MLFAASRQPQAEPVCRHTTMPEQLRCVLPGKLANIVSFREGALRILQHLEKVKAMAEADLCTRALIGDPGRNSLARNATQPASYTATY